MNFRFAQGKKRNYWNYIKEDFYFTSVSLFFLLLLLSMHYLFNIVANLGQKLN
jgi:hypothetical protein